MKLTLTKDTLLVTRENGDPRAKESGYNVRSAWSMEHHFMYMVKHAVLEHFGIPLVKVSAAKDGHLMDDQVPILRPAKPRKNATPPHNICIYDGNYMIRSAAQQYNRRELVKLTIIRDYWQ